MRWIVPILTALALAGCAASTTPCDGTRDGGIGGTGGCVNMADS